MKLFISHAATDLSVAQVLRVHIDRLSDEINCFLLADDALGGDLWEDQIRAAADECDAIVSLVTPNYVARPWFIAEWAVFWFQGKHWYLMVDDVDLDTLFEPMRRRQASIVDDFDSLKRFLEGLGVDSGFASLDVVASKLQKALREARQNQAKAALEDNVRRLKASFQRGTGGAVRQTVVEDILAVDGPARLMEVGRGSNNAVAQRQLAAILVRMGRPGNAGEIARKISNNAERKNVGLEGLARLESDPADEGTRRLVLDIYSWVRGPQRRELRDTAQAAGVEVEWPEVAPNP